MVHHNTNAKGERDGRKMSYRAAALSSLSWCWRSCKDEQDSDNNNKSDSDAWWCWRSCKDEQDSSNAKCESDGSKRQHTHTRRKQEAPQRLLQG
jgi:hypothetical protein